MGSCNSCSSGTCGPIGADYADTEGENVPYNKKKVKKLSKHDEMMTYG